MGEGNGLKFDVEINRGKKESISRWNLKACGSTYGNFDGEILSFEQLMISDGVGLD